MDKTDFIEVSPPLGPVIVLRGNYHLVSPAFDEDGKLEELRFHVHTDKSDRMVSMGDASGMRYISTNVHIYIGDDARKIASVLNSRFDLHIGKSSSISQVQEVKSTLE